MWGLMMTILLMLYGWMCLYIGRKGWKLFGKPASRFGRSLFVSAFILLVLPFPLAELGEDILPDRAVSWLTIWGGHSMIMLLYLCLLLLLIDVIGWIDRRLRFIPSAVSKHPLMPFLLAVAVILLTMGTVAYGSWNAQHPVTQKYEIAIDKNSDLEQLRIAMVSDIHYGPIVNAARLEQLRKMIDQIRPDLVLVAGDLTDSSLPPHEAEKLASLLGKIQAPYGTFAVPGNHDHDLRRPDSRLMQALEKENIHVLKDTHILIKNRFYLIGRDDPNRRREPARKDLNDLMKGIDRSKPLILLDHQPIELDKAKSCGIDLQLSGHTHNGQIFPANLITRQVYEMDWGLLKKEAYHLIVSCGFGTWGPPLRIGNHPEVVQIDMTFQ